MILSPGHYVRSDGLPKTGPGQRAAGPEQTNDRVDSVCTNR